MNHWSKPMLVALAVLCVAAVVVFLWAMVELGRG